MQGDFQQREAQLVEKDAERVAELAEEIAAAAVTLAGYCLDAAEWTVVRAELARDQTAPPNVKSDARAGNFAATRCLSSACGGVAAQPIGGRSPVAAAA